MTVTGLTRGALYQFSVSAINTIGESLLSSISSIYAATVPLAPAAPTIVLQTASAITIKWIEPDNGGNNIDDYQVKMCLGSSASCSFATIAVTTNGAT